MAEVVKRHGVAGTSMREVAEVAECGRATLYRYFGKREELFAAFMEQQAERVVDALIAHTEPNDTFEDKLLDAVVSSIQFIRSDPLVTPFFAPEAMGITKSVASQAQGLHEQLHRGMAHLMTSEEVPFRSSLDPRDVLDWILRCILSLATFDGLQHHDGKQLENYVRAYVIFRWCHRKAGEIKMPHSVLMQLGRRYRIVPAGFIAATLVVACGSPQREPWVSCNADGPGIENYLCTDLNQGALFPAYALGVPISLSAGWPTQLPHRNDEWRVR